MRTSIFVLTMMLGGAVHAQSLADRADAIERAYGYTPPPSPAIRGPAYVGFGGYNFDAQTSKRLQRGSGLTPIANPNTYFRPIVHPPSYPPHGPIRYIRGPYGEVVPDYIIPYGRRGNYRFAGIR
jgi:hypothetical protein